MSFLHESQEISHDEHVHPARVLGVCVGSSLQPVVCKNFCFSAFYSFEYLLRHIFCGISGTRATFLLPSSGIESLMVFFSKFVSVMYG